MKGIDESAAGGERRRPEGAMIPVCTFVVIFYMYYYKYLRT